MIDVEVNTTVVTTLRELEPGQFYVTVRDLRRGDALTRVVRLRTEDPFKSKTVFGTTVLSYPSDKVHPASVQGVNAAKFTE